MSSDVSKCFAITGSALVLLIAFALLAQTGHCQTISDTPQPQQQHRTFDKQFALHTTFNLAGIAFDGVTTAISQNNGCEETGAGFVRKHHSSGMQITKNLLPQAIASVVFNILLYRKTKGKIDSWVTFLPSDGVGAEHFAAGAMNISSGCVTHNYNMAQPAPPQL